MSEISQVKIDLLRQEIKLAREDAKGRGANSFEAGELRGLLYAAGLFDIEEQA